MPARARPLWLRGLPRGEPRASGVVGSRTRSCLSCLRVGGAPSVSPRRRASGRRRNSAKRPSVSTLYSMPPSLNGSTKGTRCVLAVKSAKCVSAVSVRCASVASRTLARNAARSFATHACAASEDASPCHSSCRSVLSAPVRLICPARDARAAAAWRRRASACGADARAAWASAPVSVSGAHDTRRRRAGRAVPGACEVLRIPPVWRAPAAGAASPGPSGMSWRAACVCGAVVSAALACAHHHVEPSPSGSSPPLPAPVGSPDPALPCARARGRL
eukprot:2132479-Pleurochrysis_carterae.AAC.1